MRIFVAGATGAIGRSLLPRLVAAGHDVSGLTRKKEKTRQINAAGAKPVVADALDRVAVRTAVEFVEPDVIVHELTDLRGASNLRRFDRVFAASNRLRTEGTDNLLAAARQVGVARFVAQSFCGWPFARIGGAVKTETDPLDPEPPKELQRT